MTSSMVNFKMTMTLRKSLKFQSWHRGTRENDLLLGRFADAHLDCFSEEDLNMYGDLLTYPDPDLYDWLIRHHHTYPPHLAKIIQQIQQFYQ